MRRRFRCGGGICHRRARKDLISSRYPRASARGYFLCFSVPVLPRAEKVPDDTAFSVAKNKIARSDSQKSKTGRRRITADNFAAVAYTPREMNEKKHTCKDNVKKLKDILVAEDILVFFFETADGAACAAVYTDGMTDKALLGEQVARPLAAERAPENAKQAAKCLQVPECKEENDFTKMAEEVLAGNVALFIDGIGGALILGLKKISLRAIMEPPSSIAIKGPREGFIEDIKTNMSLLRNRLQTPKLRFYNLVAGKQSRTKIAVGYLDGIADEKTVQKIVKKIEEIDIDGIPDSSYVGKFLAERPQSLFKPTGTTEKPDVLAAKMLEGRVAILVDGSPIALTLPYLLSEDFQGAQDYFSSPYRASVSRFLRFFGVFLSVFLPAFYVSAQLFKLQLLPFSFLLTISGSIQGIPLSPSLELFFLLLVLEILIEASVRMPKYVALALSVIGALVLGDTAVKAGLVSSSAIIIMALSGIAAYTVPDLVGTVSVLRIAYVVVAGSVGTFGVLLLTALILYYLVTSDAYGSPMLAPFAPLIARDLKDSLYKASLFALDKRPKVFRGKNKTRLKRTGKKVENGQD